MKISRLLILSAVVAALTPGLRADETRSGPEHAKAKLGMDPKDVKRRILLARPELAGGSAPKSGLMASLKRGTANLISDFSTAWGGATGDATQADPVCSKSPHHDRVVQLVRQAPSRREQPIVFRTDAASRELHPL